MRTITAFIISFVSFTNTFSQPVDSLKKYPPLKVPAKALNFIAMGDWGRSGEFNQKEVAKQMGIIAKSLKGSFIMALGDNFYPNGVASVYDHRWLESFENIYTDFSLQDDWFVVLGNHDYGGNPQAEVDYTKIDRRWNMPERYYSKKMVLKDDTSKEVLFVYLDTTPLLSEYYSKEGHAANVKTQDTAEQRIWLENVLSDPSPKIKWRIVAGHHPLYTGGGRMSAPETIELNQLLKPIFDKYKVDAYICGHEHSLQYIKPGGATHYFISGAGSETTPTVVYPAWGKFAISQNGFFCILPDFQRPLSAGGQFKRECFVFGGHTEMTHASARSITKS